VNHRVTGPTRREFIALTGTAALSAVLARHAAGQARTRVALVGTGIRGITMWGRDLVEDYADVVEFVGLCDINPGRLSYGRSYIGADCPTFTDFDEMMQATSPEVLIVTTMDSTHDQFIVSGMEYGADIVTEKPFTTDAEKLQRILDAQERTGRDIVVTHNYRYSPHRLRMKELLAAGRIGTLTSVDFHWYLDIYHGAAYFRRWHGKERYSGTLFVHKACHHFDLLNWWIDSDPEVVYANGALEHYGHNNPFRSTNCRGCPHADRCDFAWDITQNERLMRLYVDNEGYDGYLRDGCVWSEEIDIFDKMSAQIRYMNGVDVSYSCTTYSPYEGYRIAFNGTEGRLEAWVKERQPWDAEDYDELRVTDNFGQMELIRIPHGGGGHGGGDQRLQDRIFREPNAPDPFGQAADARQGAMAVLIGFAARRSARSGQPVRIGDLTSLEPRMRR
jgi:predicted dehydrogenase